MPSALCWRCFGENVLPLMPQAERPVDATLPAVAEPAVERGLQRVVLRVEDRPRRDDRAEAAVRTHQVGRDRARARDRARRRRRILILRQIRRADVRRVQIHRIVVGRHRDGAERDRVVVMRADIRHVERRRPRQHHLHAAVPRGRRADLRVVVIDEHDGRRLDACRALRDLLQRRVDDGRALAGRRVADLAEDRIALQSIVEDADAAANDDPLRARHVVGRADARTEDQRLFCVVLLRDAVAGLDDPVQQRAGVRHDRADRDRRARAERRAGPGIDGHARATGAGAAGAAGHIEQAERCSRTTDRGRSSTPAA